MPSIGYATLKAVKPFTFDGKRVKVSMKRGIVSGVSATSGLSCGPDGCGQNGCVTAIR